MSSKYDDPKQKKAGPSGLAAGTKERLADVERWRLDPDPLAALVGEHRAGYPSATRRLMLACEHVLWAIVKDHEGFPSDHLTGRAWLRFVELIYAIRHNDWPADQIEHKLWWELFWHFPGPYVRNHLRWCGDEDNPSTLFKGPSRSTRRRKGLDRPKRVRSDDLTIHKRLIDMMSTNDTRPHRKQYADRDVTLTLDVERAVSGASPAARRIAIRILDDGPSKRQLADEQGVSRYEIDIELRSLAADLQDHDPRPPSRR